MGITKSMRLAVALAVCTAVTALTGIATTAPAAVIAQADATGTAHVAVVIGNTTLTLG